METMEVMELAIEAVEKKQMSTERSIKKDLEQKQISEFKSVKAATCMDYLKVILTLSADIELKYIYSYPNNERYQNIEASEEIRNIVSSLLKERNWINRCSQRLEQKNGGLEMDSLVLMVCENNRAAGWRMLVRLNLVDAFIRLYHMSLMAMDGKDWLLDIGKEYCRAETALIALCQASSKQPYDVRSLLNDEYHKIKNLERQINDMLKELHQLAEKVKQRMSQLYNTAYAKLAWTNRYENVNTWEDETKRNLDWITDQMIELAMEVRFADAPIGDSITRQLWNSIVEVHDRILEFDSGLDEIRLITTLSTAMIPKKESEPPKQSDESK